MKKICVFIWILGCSFLGFSAVGSEQPYIDHLPETERVFASLLNDNNYQSFTEMSGEERQRCIDMWNSYDETGNYARPDAIVDKVLAEREDRL